MPVKLGRGGLKEIVELDLNDGELKELQDSAASIADNVEKLGL